MDIPKYPREENRIHSSVIDRRTEAERKRSPSEIRDENRSFLDTLKKAIETVDEYTKKLEKKEGADSGTKSDAAAKEQDEEAKNASSVLEGAAALKKSEEKLLSMLHKLEKRTEQAKAEAKGDKFADSTVPDEDEKRKTGKQKGTPPTDFLPEGVIPEGGSAVKQNGGSASVGKQSSEKAEADELITGSEGGEKAETEPISGGSGEDGEKRVKTFQTKKTEAGLEKKTAEAAAHAAAQNGQNAAGAKKQRFDRDKGNEQHRAGEIREGRPVKHEKLSIEVKPVETVKDGSSDAGTKDGSFLEQGKSGSRQTIPAEFAADGWQQDSAGFKSKMVTLHHAQDLAGRLRESVNSDLVRQAKIILKDASSGEIRLVLKPEQLGNVRIRLDLQDNVIGGRIIVENSTVREIFRENIEHLQKAFAAAGMETGSLDVSVAGGETGAREEQAESRDLPGGQASALHQMESNVPSVEIIREGNSVNMVI
jgi:flagellar hook-length control protein FliK